MATIVCDSKRFVFVHIPKCAGSAIAAQLQKLVDCDPRFLGGVEDHPELGPIKTDHIPLAVLKEFYPETYGKYLDYDSYAITREPVERFVSATAQHLREFRREDLYALSSAELSRVLDEIMAQMTKTPVATPAEYAHFTRQADFVYLDGDRIVENLYAPATLGGLGRDLNRYGIRVATNEVTNMTVHYRSRTVKRLIKTGRKVARALLPKPMHRALDSRLRSAVAASSAKSRPAAFSSHTVQDFLKDFYSADFRLWEDMADPAFARRPRTLKATAMGGRIGC